MSSVKIRQNAHGKHRACVIPARTDKSRGNTMRIRLDISNSRRRNRSAFTLVEALVAFAFVAVTMVSLWAAICYGLSVTAVARENLRATQLILEKFETIRLYTWDQIQGSNGFIIPTSFTNTYAIDASGNQSGVTYTGTMTFVAAPVGASYSSDLKLVTVTLNWTSAGIPRTRTMQTMIARQGLQQYVY
jgi:Tfp pilus assembly protein PilV